MFNLHSYFLLTFYQFLFAVGQSENFGFEDLNLSVLCHQFSSLTPKNNHLQSSKTLMVHQKTKINVRTSCYLKSDKDKFSSQSENLVKMQKRSHEPIQFCPEVGNK